MIFGPPPPPINLVHGSCMLDMDIIVHVAAALGPLAYPSRSARSRKCLNLTLNNAKDMYKIDTGAGEGVQKSLSRTDPKLKRSFIFNTNLYHFRNNFHYSTCQ